MSEAILDHPPATSHRSADHRQRRQPSRDQPSPELATSPQNWDVCYGMFGVLVMQQKLTYIPYWLQSSTSLHNLPLEFTATFHPDYGSSLTNMGIYIIFSPLFAPLIRNLTIQATQVYPPQTVGFDMDAWSIMTFFNFAYTW